VEDAPNLYVLGALSALTPVQKALPEEARAALLALRQGAAAEVQTPQAKPVEADRQALGTALEIAPPWEPEGLARLARTSSALRPCITAYSIMGPGFGYTLKPVIDVTSPGAADRVRKAMVADRLLRATEPGGPPYAEPADDEVERMRVQIEREMAVEEAKLTRFLGHCGIDRDLTQLRKERWQESESEGNAYWEVLRRCDGEHGALDGTPAYFKPVPATTVRLRQIERDTVMLKRRERVSLLRFEEVEIPWRFRSLVQRVHGMDTTYFREHGDLRPRSARTGRVYASMEELRASGEPLATELVHWKVFDPDTPYGVPRWISAEFSVGGIQEAERVNYYYFDGRAIPPGILAVSGGRLKEGAAQLIEKTLTDRAAGRAAFYSMMVIEATATGDASTARCRIEWIPLTDGSENDGRFLEYQRAEGVKVQMQFRLPDIIVGRSQEVNKAQAEAAIGFTEQMVVQPLRQDEDGWWNRLLADMGFKWWAFKTNSATASDPEQQMRLIAMAVKDAGTLTPGEGRELTGDVFNRKLDPIDAPWTKQPLALTLAGIPVEAPAAGGPMATTATPITPAQAADALERARSVAAQLRSTAAGSRAAAEQGAIGDAQMDRARDALVIPIDVDTVKSWIEEDK
jgi:capsid portal protein